MTLEEALFGFVDSNAIAQAVDEYCSRHLGAAMGRVIWHRTSVALVFGLELVDGRRVVVKLHRPDRAAKLGVIQAIQRRLGRRDYPCPQPLVGPAALANGVATAESLLEGGRIIDAHDPARRLLMASGLHDLVVACAPIADTYDPGPYWLTSSPTLWPAPHDVRFDFEATASGAEWIDDLARSARQRLIAAPGRLVLGHIDWRVENLRVEAGRIVAVYDWGSLARLPEPVLVGAVAHAFTASWDPEAPFTVPTLAESRAFIEDYALARDAPFSAPEIEQIDAAHLLSLAYAARCEHSDAVLQLFPKAKAVRGYRSELAERGQYWLASTLSRQ